MIEKELKAFQTEEYGKVLNSRQMGRKFFWQEETDSTNTWAKTYGKKLLEQEKSPGPWEEEADSVLFLAEKQNGGKGRFGRVWNSPPGQNVYMSLLLWKPEISPQAAARLTLVMGLSVAQAASDITQKPVGIKWPNDVVMSGKKICGILTEMQMEGQKAAFIVIGVGINVNQEAFAPEIQDKATSLLLEKGCQVSREEMAARTMEHFEWNYRKLLQIGDLSLLQKDYESLLLNKDRQVRIIEKQQETIGIARGITETGELLVEDEQGNIRKILSGEVSVRGLYSYV